MDREFSKDISSYKQKAAKGFSGAELAKLYNAPG